VIRSRIDGPVAGIANLETLPVCHTEPVNLSVARQLAALPQGENVRSVLVVSPGFRSARSYLVYAAVFTPLVIRVECPAAPTPGSTANGGGTPGTAFKTPASSWPNSSTYRFWVL
jgi:hypothetical protein